MKDEKATAQNGLCRRYCRELRRALACVPELRDRTVVQMTDSLEEYLEDHPEADYHQLVQEFGTPEQAAENVLNELDAKQVQQALKRYRWQRTAAIVLAGILIALAIAWAAFGLFGWFQDSMNPPYIIEGPAVEYTGPLPPTMAK